MLQDILVLVQMFSSERTRRALPYEAARSKCFRYILSRQTGKIYSEERVLITSLDYTSKRLG